MNSLADEIAIIGGKCRIAACDVCERVAMNALFPICRHSTFSSTMQGPTFSQPALEVDEAAFDRIFDLNVKAAFFTAQAAARRMRAAGTRGSIINMSSQAGHVALRHRAVYCATKHAMEGFTKVMAVELAPLGIRVNTIAPTFIDPLMTKLFLADGDFADYARANIPLGHFGTVEDIEGAVLYLASPSARLVTRASLNSPWRVDRPMSVPALCLWRGMSPNFMDRPGRYAGSLST